VRIAVTGGSGRVGTAVVEAALARGDSVVNVDRTAGPARAGVTAVVADTADYDGLARAFAGCDALIHLAAIAVPFDDPDHVVHNANVVGSYNALRAAIAAGITRLCQASSVNAVGLSYSRAPRFDYFPIDEAHPSYAEDPYSLSKWVCEQQADSLVRRYTVSIASLRYHWVVPRAVAAERYNQPGEERHLWSYTLPAAAARAALLAVDRALPGHEAYFITADTTTHPEPSRMLASRHYPDVPIRGALEGSASFFDCSKASRLLGWRHDG
jgi:UDP-glucose 4-epimerase